MAQKFNSYEKHELMKCLPWMQYKSLWINVSPKCIKVHLKHIEYWIYIIYNIVYLIFLLLRLFTPVAKSDAQRVFVFNGPVSSSKPSKYEENIFKYI